MTDNLQRDAQAQELVGQVTWLSVRAANLAGELAAAKAKIEELEHIVQMKASQ